MRNSGAATKNDEAWARLFEQYDILAKVDRFGMFEITAAQINHYREARLMTKFDHRSNLPRLFAKHKLAILPVTRGSYAIARFDAYQNFEEKDTRVHRISAPAHIESIEYDHITSEAIAVNCAYVSGILADFTGESGLMPTVSGRMGSARFSFRIRDQRSTSILPLQVANAQVEIDGGYEGPGSLSLIEAKNMISDDFLIRQLYYPYRLWSLNLNKRVRPIFMVYSNGIFKLYEYEFETPEFYNSLRLIQQKNYRIETEEITLEDIRRVWQDAQIVPEPEVPFPQADRFDRVVNLCERLAAHALSRDEITLNYDFDVRQTGYYTDAARYLGLLIRKRGDGEVIYCLTEEGRKLLKQKYKARQLRLAALILRHQVFHAAQQLRFSEGRMPDKGTIVELMKASNLYRVEAEDTYRRRASTILGWLNWIEALPA